MQNRHLILSFFFFAVANGFSQIGIPVYSDYLSDNYYLLHPSMAGASNCDKLRLTARKQWFDQDDAPELQTLSYNGKLHTNSGYGVILMNDRNGFHSQKGLKLSYAHHLLLSRDEVDLNQLSFGLSGNIFQSQLDETSLLPAGQFDPIINGTIVQDASYFNVDIGASYNFLNFYVHATAHNIIENKQKIYTEREAANLRRYLLGAGVVFGDDNDLLWEPSLLFQLLDNTNEKALDLNLKVYKIIDYGKIWAALSYRTSFDGAKYANGNKVASQNLQYITPILGVNYKKIMLSYTYSYLPGDIDIGSSLHQITLGYDLFCRGEKYDCDCPAIN